MSGLDARNERSFEEDEEEEDLEEEDREDEEECDEGAFCSLKTSDMKKEDQS